MTAVINRISVPLVLAAFFLALGATFLLDLWDRPAALYPVLSIDSSFADPATVRQSAADLIRTDGDISMFECYGCHDPKSPPIVDRDEDGNVIWEEHQVDFDLMHGSKHRNDHCFNCHAPDSLERLKTRDGRYLTIDQGNDLCGSCHGETYRDWEVAVHGRMNGYWDTKLGAAIRQDCTSCHNPHSPAFPSIAPAPGPQPLRLVSAHAVVTNSKSDLFENVEE